MKNKLCYIGFQASRYREAIFCAIDSEYECDWYFGKPENDIINMDISKLKRFYRFDSIGNPHKLYWKKNVIKLLFCKNYSAFLMGSESRCLSDYLFIGLSKFTRKKIYLWTHGWYGKETKIESYLKRWQFRNVDGVFVYSNYARNLMINTGLSPEKIHTIHNSLDYEKQLEIRKHIVSSSFFSSHFGNSFRVIIFIGRLTKVKKLDLLIDAVAKLNQSSNKFNLVFVGDGTERQRLENKVKGLHIQSYVWFYGACYDEEKNAELIYNADLCVSPGNVGLTAMHALVFGCPVITHDCFKWQMPEFEAIKPGVTGDFFAMDDVESLTNTIKKWFDKNESNKESVREACFKEIDSEWNPNYQMNVFKKYIKL